MPGEPGNVAIAGHRVGRGAPFLDLDQLRSCDPLVIETGSALLVYRVLPPADELSDWATGRGRDPECVTTRPLNGPYAGVVGQEIVTPGHVEVVATAPDHPDARPAPPLALLSLTTCNPKFSAHQSLFIQAALAARYAKDLSGLRGDRRNSTGHKLQVTALPRRRFVRFANCPGRAPNLALCATPLCRSWGCGSL